MASANVAAHSGLNIVFDVTTEGDGLYDMRNTIYVDPNAPAERIRAKLLLHEGGHALFWRTKKGKKLLHDAAKMLDADKAKEIEERYTEYYEKKNVPKETYLPIIEEEIAAAALEDVLGSTDAWEYILAEDPQYESRLLSFFAKAAQDYKHLKDLPADARKLMRQYKTLFQELSARNQGNNATDTRPAVQTQKSVTRMNDENMQVTENRKALNEKAASRITPGMSEEERAEFLRTQAVSVVKISLPDDLDISIEQLERNMKSAVEKPLIQKMRAMGHLRHYQTNSIEVGFDFTGEGLRKSMNSQVSDYGGNLADLAKVVMNMQPLLDSAALLEIHADKAKGTLRENPQLLQTYVLLSAFAEGEAITPVQFEIKQYVDDNNRLYLAVALTKIKTGVMGDTILENQASTHLLPVSTISIPDLLQKINPRDENFFKYAPDEFLSEAQLAAKRRALDREARKYQKKAEKSQTSTDLMERHALPEDGRKAGYSMAELMEGMPYDPDYVLQKGRPRVSGRTSITDGEMQYRIADKKFNRYS